METLNEALTNIRATIIKRTKIAILELEGVLANFEQINEVQFETMVKDCPDYMDHHMLPNNNCHNSKNYTNTCGFVLCPLLDLDKEMEDGT